MHMGLSSPYCWRSASASCSETKPPDADIWAMYERDVVARRELDDDERQDRDGPHREQRQDQPLDEIREHGG